MLAEQREPSSPHGHSAAPSYSPRIDPARTRYLLWTYLHSTQKRPIARAEHPDSSSSPRKMSVTGKSTKAVEVTEDGTEIARHSWRDETLISMSPVDSVIVHSAHGKVHLSSSGSQSSEVERATQAIYGRDGALIVVRPDHTVDWIPSPEGQ